MQKISSYQPPIIMMHVSSFCKDWANESSGSSNRKPVKEVHMDSGTRWLFATTVLVGGADQKLLTLPENMLDK